MHSRHGFFRSVTGEIGKLAPERFRVTTKSATIGIRGTDFEGYTGGEKERFICNRGAIFIQTPQGERFTLEAGEFIVVGNMGVVEKGKVTSHRKTSSKSDSSKKTSHKKEEKEGEKHSSFDEKKDESSSENTRERDIEIERETRGDAHEVTPEDIADITQTADTTNNDAALQPSISGQARPIEY